jgi:hypothetical protein
LIDSDFRSEYGIDLPAVFHTMPWRRFESLVHGLLCADTRVQRHFAPKPKEVTRDGR